METSGPRESDLDVKGRPTKTRATNWSDTKLKVEVHFIYYAKLINVVYEFFTIYKKNHTQ